VRREEARVALSAGFAKRLSSDALASAPAPPVAAAASRPSRPLPRLWPSLRDCSALELAVLVAAHHAQARAQPPASGLSAVAGAAATVTLASVQAECSSRMARETRVIAALIRAPAVAAAYTRLVKAGLLAFVQKDSHAIHDAAAAPAAAVTWVSEAEASAPGPGAAAGGWRSLLFETVLERGTLPTAPALPCVDPRTLNSFLAAPDTRVPEWVLKWAHDAASGQVRSL
jgi:hypothetical protein